MNISECFEKGLLKKDRQDKEKAVKSVETAKYKLDVAKRTFDAQIFEETIINSYAAMFHAARALLFKDGVKEKSHFGLYVYIRERYKDKLEPRFVSELNALRLERHELTYGLEKPEIKEVEAEDVMDIANDFILAIEKIL